MATDDGYVPFLSSLLTSIKKTKSRQDKYAVRILYTSLCEESMRRIKRAYHSDDFTVEFCDLSPCVEKISDKLHTRDYYSKTTYYRIFIPTLFPDVSRALYLDCDVILKRDLRQLYDTPLEDALVGAVPDAFVLSTPELIPYTENCVGRHRGEYFNAGVLLMNLDAMRSFGFEERFIDLLSHVKFDIAQDQDYLNAIVGDRVRLIGEEWNRMPLVESLTPPALIHYNLHYKPWKRHGVAYADDFYECARECEYNNEISRLCKRDSSLTEEDIALSTLRLIEAATRQSLDKRKNEEIMRHVRNSLSEVIRG